MNWNTMVAVSEVVGAAAVIIPLAYLACQVRQNTRSVEGSTEQALMNAEMTLYGLLAQHAGVYRRGLLSDTSLEPDEEALFEHLVLAASSQLYGAFVQFQRRLIPKTVWNAYLNDWAEFGSQAGFRRVWSKFQNTYPVEFRQCLEEFEKPDDFQEKA